MPTQRRLIPYLILVIGLMSVAPALGQEQCPAPLGPTVATLAQACADLNRDDLCIGTGQVDLRYHDPAMTTDDAQPGDRLPLAGLDQLILQPGEDGNRPVMVASVQASYPTTGGHATRWVLVGETHITHRVPPLIAGAEMRINTTRGDEVNLRRQPGLSGSVRATLPNGTLITLTSGPYRVDDLWWWEVTTGAGLTGFVVQDVDDPMLEDGFLYRLPVIVPRETAFPLVSPGQIFDLRTGPPVSCNSAIGDGLIIQKSPGAGPVGFIINGLSIIFYGRGDVATTIYIKAAEGVPMQIYVIAGDVTVMPLGDPLLRFLSAGEVARIDFDAEGRPGFPADFDAAPRISALLVDILPLLLAPIDLPHLSEPPGTPVFTPTSTPTGNP